MHLTDPTTHAEPEIEARAGIMPAAELLQARSALIERVAPLRAMFGAFGTYDANRKIQLSIAAIRVRERLVAEGVRATDKATDELAHADTTYVEWCTEMDLRRAEWVVLENEIETINDQLFRSNALLKYVTAEVMITPSGGGAS